MSFYAWGDYVSVAEKPRQAEKTLAKLRKQGQSVAPVAIQGRKIAKSFWGQSWCTNLERYSDYAYRLPRGRSYVRNGFVVDLHIAKGLRVVTVNCRLFRDIALRYRSRPGSARRARLDCRERVRVRRLAAIPKLQGHRGRDVRAAAPNRARRSDRGL
jgi:hypothetical protein